MLRRFAILCTLLCLLSVTFRGVIPAPPLLVCRMTGRPMTPVAASSTTRRSCCAVAEARTVHGTGLTLTNPGCCDLHFSRQSAAPIAANPVAPELPLLVAWVPAPPTLFLPATKSVAVPLAAARQDAPRGPPPHRFSPRAPPAFS